MSSIFFQFYYDDGSNRPFDVEIACDADYSRLEVPPVIVDGIVDIFEISPEELQELGLMEDSFLPPFITYYQEIAQADGEPLDGVGAESNSYYDSVTLPAEPSALKLWAEAWLQTLQRMDDAERKEALSVNWKSVEEILKSLNDLIKQSDCAINNHLGIMLSIAW
jgi:hypothetical protein